MGHPLSLFVSWSTGDKWVAKVVNTFLIGIDACVNTIVIYCFYPWGETLYFRLCGLIDKFCRKYVLFSMAQKKLRYNESKITSAGDDETEIDNNGDIELKNLLSTR